MRQAGLRPGAVLIEIDEDTLLNLVGDVQGLLDIGEFRPGLIHGLMHALPSDWASINDLGPEPGAAVVLVEPAFPVAQHELFARFAHQNPLVERYRRTLDGRAYRFSDVTTPAALHALDLYREFYRPIGLEHQVAFVLPHDPGRLLGVALSRRDHDYSDAERDLLNRARPFLIQSYRNAIEHSALRDELRRRPASPDLLLADGLAQALRARGLTEREVDVLCGVATGRSTLAVGDALGITERTVQKHLERLYRKLGVHSRSEAAALAWSLADGA